MFKKYILFFILFPMMVSAQINASRNQNVLIDTLQNKKPESVPDSLKVFSPSITDYEMWSINKEKQVLDTTLSIENYYKKNVYQKDLFEFQVPSNWGKPLIPLSLNLTKRFKFTPSGKASLITHPRDVYYYDVKTPITRFIFENGAREGQFLSTLFTHSPNELVNYAIQFNSLRSQGLFQRELTSVKNFSVAVNYHTQSNRYKIETNFLAQSNKGDENGGIDSLSIEAYTSKNPDFNDVVRLTPNLTNAGSEFESKSFYLNHSFGLFKVGNDSLQPYPLRISHELNYNTNEFVYTEGADEPFFDYEEIDVEDRRSIKNYKELTNKAFVGFDLNEKLLLKGGLIYRIEQPYFDALLSTSLALPDKITENRYGIVGNAKYQWKDNITILGDVEFTNGNNFGAQYHANGQLIASFKNLFELEAQLALSSQLPSYNFILNQSFYKPFNFDHSDFKNENIQELSASLNLKPLSLKAFGGVTNITNYTYLNESQLPVQADNALNYFKIGGEHHLKWNKFHNITRVQFQKVTSEADLMPLPDVIGRLTTYYQSNIFGGSAEIQTGINVKYHTAYNARLFSPFLNEFYLQQEGKEKLVGNYPQLDFFANIKVRTMRIYLRAENLTSFVLPGENLIMPQQPFRNFKLQIGAYWTLFN